MIGSPGSRAVPARWSFGGWTLGACPLQWHRWALSVLAVVAVLFATLALATPAAAYPWMVRDGYPGCGGCHVDPSGGELLTAYGRTVAWDRLPTRWRSAPSESAPPTTALWGLAPTPDWLLTGASYRQALLWEPTTPRVATFPMEADLKLGVVSGPWLASASLGVVRLPPGSPHARAAQLTRGQGNTLELLSRTHWVGYRVSDGVVLRGGRVPLPFGVRVPEHTLWARDGTRTDRDADQSHGVALAFESGLTRGELMAVLGNYQLRPDQLRERGAVGFVETELADRVRVGVSGLWLSAAADFDTLESTRTDRRVFGVFSRAALTDQTALLFEADALTASRRDVGVAALLQLDHELFQGLHLMATGELYDGGYRELVRGAATHARRTPGNGKPKAGGWLSCAWFFLPGLDLRLDAIFRHDSPTTLFAQLHVAP